MTPDMISTIQNSFDRVFPVKEQFAETFYDKLFEIAPASRQLFPQDMVDQRLKLSDTLSYVVRNLTRPEVIEETVVGLARRHARYGAQAEHFAPVGMALIYALQAHSPNGMNSKESEAWLEAYTFISDLMIPELEGH